MITKISMKMKKFRIMRIALGFFTVFFFLSIFVIGMMIGFHMSLTPASDLKSYQKYILKGTYFFDRYDSISKLPDDFKKKWFPLIEEFSRHSRIGVYVGSGMNATPFLPLQLEKLGFDVVRFNNRETDKIHECDLIIFPGGHYNLHDLTDETKNDFIEYVQSGGGYIGICLGVLAAREIGIIKNDLNPWPVTGFIPCKIVDRSILHYSPEISSAIFLHMNGRLLTSETSLKPLVTFGEEVLAGFRDLGKGRVVLFSSHPEGGKIEYGNDYIILEGSSLKTMDLLLDAIFYVSRKSTD